MTSTDERPNVAGANRASLPVTRLRPAYQQVADQLRTLITQGELSSGDRFPPEGELGASFGVSRSTVREALRTLASQGLVETTRGTTGGTFVTRINPATVSRYLETSIGLMSGTEDLALSDLLEARDFLEVPAASLAAERHKASHLKDLRRAIEREKVSRGRAPKFTEHRQFHVVLMQATGNGLLGMVLEPVFRVLQSRFLNLVEEDAFWERVDNQHAEIADFVEAGDAQGAADAMRRHLDSIRPAYHD